MSVTMRNQRNRDKGVSVKRNQRNVKGVNEAQLASYLSVDPLLTHFPCLNLLIFSHKIFHSPISHVSTPLIFSHEISHYAITTINPITIPSIAVIAIVQPTYNATFFS